MFLGNRPCLLPPAPCLKRINSVPHQDEKRYKHGINFEEAKAVFLDPFAYIFDDEWYSVGEKREIIIGHDDKNRLLLVCFIERNNKIRIISARLTTKKERQNYEEYKKF